MRLRYIIELLLLCALSVASAADKRFTLVIDAGHGGRDAGCVGAITNEKTLTLKFAQAFGKLVEQNCPDVKVIYTRKNDRFVELNQRAEIANRNKADLFISIHINSLPGKRVAHGFQTYTLGKSRRDGNKRGYIENLEVAKRENAVIFLEKDYKQTYHGFDPNSPESAIMFEFVQDKNMENSIELAKFMQKYVCQATGRQDMGAHQDNLAVLRLTSMPGCLIELGFITARDEENFMNSTASTSKYARGIYNAFAAYKKKYWKSSTAVHFLQEPDVQPNPKLPEQKEPEPKLEKPAVQEQEVKSEPKPEAPAEPKPEVIETPDKASKADVADDLVFKVQIMTSPHQLKANDMRFKKETDVDWYTEGGMVKYTVGASADYNEIYRLRKSLLAKFPEAFIIAFKGKKKMNVQEAIRDFRSNKGKK